MKSSPLRRKRPISRHSPRKHVEKIDWQGDPNDLETVFREDVQRRSRGICELCRRAPACQIHHRRTRGVEWSRWLDVNGLDLCRACHHDVIHGNPDWSYRHGLLLRQSSTTHPLPVVGCDLTCTVDHYA